MFSGKKHLLRRRQDRDPWPKPRRRLFPKLGDRLRPRIGIQVWLTALFLLITAFAGITAYELVRPILSNTLERSNEARFSQVGEQYERLLRRSGDDVSLQRIKSFAVTHGLQWGIVRAQDQTKLQGSSALEWNPQVVRRAVNSGNPNQEIEPIETGVNTGRQLATYAAPINVPGEEGTAVVFSRYFFESELSSASDMRRINLIALLAGILALLIAGVSGYVVATLISRRVSRLGLAAERLAAGNFDERIETRVEDEVGSLGETFNSMAASLQGAFQQVEQEKERGRAILDGMTDAVVGVDKDLNAIFLNPRARELLDSSVHDFHNRLQKILARAMRDGPVTEPAVEAGNRQIEIRAAPLEEGALAILRDVTEERRVQRVKAEFIANASHELKTPLFALSGYLEMLEDEENEEVRAGFLDEMRAQTERLQNLARTLLDLSRLDANAVTFRLEEVDLADLLYELRRDFSYTGRPVNVHTEESVPPVKTDPTQLHRMLAILLDNALKYSSKDSPVGLELSREDGHAVISVSDQGCGIPEEEQPHIFDRFYRAQGSSRADGTGLGLALASEITDHLGGEILVESEPEAGSTFSVILPFPETPDEPQNGQTS
ncbi:MAG: cell wall metabolism sensor histidine kinase WalK [Actinomycetota bacterium]|nr:cell wall metabolism sensor histidine kinase WalK [Actinomycetota bacterium]